MKTITRKAMLYPTGVEYGDYSMNHVLGCAHGCEYPCYAYLMKKRFGQVETYEEWCEPKLVANTLELLDKEIPRLKDKIKSVFLCFSTDPFPYWDDENEVRAMSISVIHKLSDAGIKCTVLTKGLLTVCAVNWLPENEYGISLVSLNEDFRQWYEPNTAPYYHRIERLKFLHEIGCKTWVSMEPYPTPNIIEQSLTDILNSVSFVDKIIFGRWNYSKEVNAYPNHREFYNDCATQVQKFCEKHGIECRIKKGTLT